MSALTALRRRLPAPFQILVLLALAIVPLLYAGALIDANLDPTGRLDQVPAAVVDADRGAQVTDADGDVRELTLGDDLTEQLLDPDADSGFGWTTASAEEAAEGLADGSYAAVLTIPADFSARVASASTVDGDAATDASQALLTITTNDATSYVTGNVADSIGQRLQQEIRSSISQEYLADVYLGFTSIHNSLGEAVSGASELAAGASDAADGASDLDAGAADLAAGAADADDGASDLADGLAELQSQASGLPQGLSDAADGAAQASTGADDLSAGLEQLRTGTADLDDGAQQALTGAQTLDDGLGSLAASTLELSDGAAEVSDGLQALLDGYAGMTDAERLAVLQELASGAGEVADGAAAANGSAAGLATGADSLVGDADTGLTALAAGAAAAETGAADAADGAAELSAGLGPLASRLAEASDEAPALLAGIGSASEGADRLATGTADLDDGAQQLLEGADSLAAGTADLDDGAATLSTELSDGVEQIPTFSDDEATTLADVSGDPVSLDAERDNAVDGYGSGLAPYFLALGLWVGAMGTFFMRAPVTEAQLRSRRPALLVALTAAAPTLGLALVQAGVASLVIHLVIGIEVADVAALVGVSMLASLTFMALNQGLNALLGPVGRFVALLLTVLQLTSAAGTYPIETTPRLFQVLHDWLPLPYALQALRSAIAGGDLGIGRGAVVLGLWLLLGLVLLTVGIVRGRRRAAAEDLGAETDVETPDGDGVVTQGSDAIEPPTSVASDLSEVAASERGAHADDPEREPGVVADACAAPHAGEPQEAGSETPRGEPGSERLDPSDTTEHAAHAAHDDTDGRAEPDEADDTAERDPASRGPRHAEVGAAR